MLKLNPVPSKPALEKEGKGKDVLFAATLGVVLGLILEAITLLVIANPDNFPGFARIAADTVQKVSWSSLVCAGLALVQSVSRSVNVAGLLSLLISMPSFVLARALHKATVEAMGSDASQGILQWNIIGVKGIEYGLIGALLYILAKKEGSFLQYALTGVLVGTVAYFLTGMFLTVPADPLQRVIGEIFHPVGCTLAVFIATRFGGKS